MRCEWLLLSALLLTQRGAWAQMPQQAGESHEDPEPPAEPPKLSVVRYVESYAYLKDPRHRTGAWWERLKYFPLTRDGALYVTLGDDLRIRSELLVHAHFEEGPRPVDPYLRYRQLPYGDLHIGEHARLFLQLMGTYALRSHLTKTAALDQSGVEVLQAFAESKANVAGDHELLVRIGRWSMAYGGQRLVSPGPNVRSSFEGALARWQHRNWRVDAFFVWPIAPRFGVFNDDVDRTRRLWSVYLIREVPLFGPTAAVEVFYFGFVNEDAQFDEGRGVEHRHTLGIRFAGGTPGRWEWDVETHQQLGTFGDSSIHAWSVGTAQRYGFSTWPLRPTLELRFNAISGDARAGDGRLGTFNPLFTTGEYFGDVTEIGPANLVNLRATGTFDLGRGVRLNGAVAPYWRASTGDAIYNPGLRILRPSGGSERRFVGTQLEAQIAWLASRNLSTRLEYITILPGGFIADTGPALAIHFALLESAFRF